MLTKNKTAGLSGFFPTYGTANWICFRPHERGGKEALS